MVWGSRSLSCGKGCASLGDTRLVGRRRSGNNMAAPAGLLSAREGGKVRTVYATVLEVTNQQDISSALEYVGLWISDWYRRQRVSVDDALGSMLSGDIETAPIEGHLLAVKHFAASAFPGQSLIELNWTYPDQYDESLGWATRLLLLRRSAGLLMSLEVAVTGLSFRIAPAAIRLGSPRVVRDVARLRSAYLGGQPYNVASELVSAETVDLLAGELTDAARAYAVVLVSRRARDDAPLMDAVSLADRIAGVAKVYELADKWSSFRLTEVVGKPLSCFDGAVRIYWPGFSLQSDPFQHPLWTPWHLADEGLAERGMRQVSRALFDAASFRHIEPADMRAIRQASERESRQATRATAAESADTDKLLEDLYSLEDKLKEAEAQNAVMAREFETLRANALALAGNASWTPEVTPAVPSAAVGNEAPPANVLEAVKSIDRSLKHLEFLPGVYDSAEDSPFRQPERVVQALEAIDEVAATWVASLTSGASVGSLRELFKKKYGFEYADDVSQTSKGKWANQYKVAHKGKEYDISPHITIGAKQADTCLSIHWAWDKDRKKVLIAHVGRHKTNTKT